MARRRSRRRTHDRKEDRPGQDCSRSSQRPRCSRLPAPRRRQRGAPSAAAAQRGGPERAPRRLTAAPSAAGAVHDRLLERRRRRQRLPRGAGLHGQGPGAVLRPGHQAHHHPPQHGRGRPAAGHPRPDRGGRRRDHLQPERPGCAQPGARRGQGRGHRRPSRSTRSSPTRTPTTCTTTRRSTPTSAPTWLFEQLSGDGQRRVHARHRRPPGRHRPRHRVQEAPSPRIPGITVVPSDEGVHTDWDPAKATQINDFIASGGTTTSTASGRPASTRIVDASRPPASRRADRRRGPRRVRRPAHSTRPIAGLKGAAVTNTAAVGGAGVGLALKLLNGEPSRRRRRERAEHGPPRPGRRDNVTDEGKALSSRGRSTVSIRSGRSVSIEG